MSFKEERLKAIRALNAAGDPPKGHHWSAGYDADGGVLPKKRKTLARKGGLVLHREIEGREIGKYAVTDCESGLGWIFLGHRALAESVVKRHGDVWPAILREVEDAASAPEGEKREHRERWMNLLVAVRLVYMRADPGEDDGGIPYDVKEPPPDERLGEAATYGLGVGSGFRGPLIVLARKADGGPRAWVRRTYSGWARFDAGARDESEHLRFIRQNMGRGDVLVREFQSLKRALAAEGRPKDGDLPPNVALLKFDEPDKPKSTREDFRHAYVDALERMVRKKPGDYTYGPDQVPAVAERMISALASGSANLGSAAKAAARACGIRPTLKAIRAFLSEP